MVNFYIAPFFVAGAALGEPLFPFFVAGARNLKLQVAKRVANCLIVTLESNVMLVLRGRRGTRNRNVGSVLKIDYVT